MSKQIKKVTAERFTARKYRKDRIRDKISGTPACPRMSVFKSDKHFNVQIIDDESGTTLVHCSTMSKDIKGTIKANIAGAKQLGKKVAEEAIKKNIKKVVFDRNGYRYHGTIKALADSAREAGLTI